MSREEGTEKSCQLPVASCQGLPIADCRMPIEKELRIDDCTQAGSTEHGRDGRATAGLSADSDAAGNSSPSAIGNRQSAIPSDLSGNWQLATGNSPRILIIKPSAIGDVVHTLPILNLLRRRWPKAEISWVVTPACAGLLEGHPQLDHVILFDRKRLGTIVTRPWRFFELRRFVKSLRRSHFDLVLDLQGLFRSGWMAWRTGSKQRVGFGNAREFAWLFYNRRVPIDTMEQHAIDRYLAMARFIGCDPAPVEFHFNTTDADRQKVAQLLEASQSAIGNPQSAVPYAVLLPGTNWPTKRWPIEKFAALVQPLREQFGLPSVLAGGPDAAALASQVPGALNLAGKTTLRELTALLENAALVIANDSGPMHIASALGRPLVTVFGPTNPVRTGPFGRMETVVQAQIECGPCYSRTCSHQSCLRQIEVSHILEAARQQLTRPSPGPARTIPLRILPNP